MTTPVVATIASGNDTGNATSHTVNLPSGTVSGNLMITQVSMDGNTTLTWPAGWTVLAPATSSGGDGTQEVRYRFADGGEGASMIVTTAGSEAGSWISYRITLAHASTPPEAGITTTGSSGSPNPPSVTASWGAEDNLFIATYGWGVGNQGHTSFPTGYTGSQTVATFSNTNVAASAMATKAATAATDDPGNATISTSTWVANTLVVRPAAVVGGLAQPIFSKEIQSVLFGGRVVH